MSIMFLMKCLIPLLIILLITVPLKALELPKSLNHKDRMDVVRLIGLGTSSKLLTNPFPLGGYPGIEVGLSLEFINIADLSHLSASPVKDERKFQYPRLSFGKGFYNNLDIFLHFIPFSERGRMSEYGGLFRWCFYQAKFLPISLSLLLHGSVLNINDSLSSQSLGSEIIVGINMKNFSLYFGGGRVSSTVEFIAPKPDGATTASSSPNSLGTIKESDRKAHSVIGVTVHLSEYFMAAQVDHYHNPVYGLKLGLRF